MPNFTISPNMNLPVPIVAVDPGPEYAIDIDSCLAIIDQHNHTPGSGVAITPAGMNINADLPFNNNNLTSAKTVRFQPQLSPIPATGVNIGCIYEAGVDLYYNDGAGNIIRLTASGSVAGTSGSISNLVPPASASYNSISSTFVWQSNTNTAANLDAASIILRDLVANSPGLTLSPPAAMASDYSIVLPSLPAQQSFVTLDQFGQMAAPWTVDGVTVKIVANQLVAESPDNVTLQASGSNVLSVKNGGITQVKLAPLPIARSGSTGIIFPINSSFTTVATCAALTSVGRPAMIKFQPDGTGSQAFISWDGTAGHMSIQILRNGTAISESIWDNADGTSTVIPNIIDFIDISPPAGSNVYSLQLAFESPINGEVANCELVAYEL